MEGQGRSFPDIRLTFQVRKVIVRVVWWWPVGYFGLWTFGTWICDFGLRLDNYRSGSLVCCPIKKTMIASIVCSEICS